MKNIFRNSDGEVDAQIVVAAIAAAATIPAALIAGFFGLIQLQASRSQASQPTTTPLATHSHSLPRNDISRVGIR